MAVLLVSFPAGLAEEVAGMVARVVVQAASRHVPPSVQPQNGCPVPGRSLAGMAVALAASSGTGCPDQRGDSLASMTPLSSLFRRQNRRTRDQDRFPSLFCPLLLL